MTRPRILLDFGPGQLVLVVKQMPQLRARNGGKAARDLVLGRPLKFDRADKIAAGRGGAPAFHEGQEPSRVADDIREQPVDRADRTRIEREGAVEAVLNLGQSRDRGRQRRLVDADHMRTHALQCPAPAAWTAAEVETPLPRPRTAP